MLPLLILAHDPNLDLLHVSLLQIVKDNLFTGPDLIFGVAVSGA